MKATRDMRHIQQNDITLYYIKLKEKDSYVFIITAFSDWR